MVRQVPFLQFILDLKYFLLTQSCIVPWTKIWTAERISILCWVLPECILVQDCGLHLSFFFFFFSDLRGFVNLEVLHKSFKGGCILKPNLVLNFCKLEIFKNVFCIPE